MKAPGPEPRAAADLPTQAAALAELLRPNEVVTAILERAPALGLPGWYLGAGGIAQTVWNVLHGYSPQQSIKDYDLVYFDGDDHSEAGEAANVRRVRNCFADLGVEVDVTNEARVHLWYERRFGFPCPAYSSTEDAITTWPTTATAVGVRSVDGELEVCAPFGLHDVLALIVRPNTSLIDERVYLAKVQRWRAAWPLLTILPWPG